LHRRLLTLRAYYFTLFASHGVYLPFFPPWLEARGVRGLSLSIVMATFPAMSIAGPLAFGMLADALGLRGSLLRAACGGAFAGFVAVSALALAGGPIHLGPLFAAILLFAFFRSPMTMMADVLALEQSIEAGIPYGATRLWGTLGFVASVLVGGVVIDPARPAQIPAAVAAGLLCTFAVSFTLPARIPTPTRPVARHVRAFVASPDVTLFLLGAFVSQAANACYDLCFSSYLFARGASSFTVGTAWAIGSFAEVAIMARYDLLTARASPPLLLKFAYGGAALRWILIATLPGTLPLLLLQPMHAISFGLMWVSSLAFVKERAPAHMIGTAQGIFTATVSAGTVSGILLWGPLYQRVGGSSTFLTAAGVSGCACLLAVAFTRKLRALRAAPVVSEAP
jgi:MFS transporter, PPP family, 3-phenylpropionic acid transporter